MVDLIDRQDLLKNLNRFAPEKYDALVNDIIKKQPTIEVKPQWIPCSERLPEDDNEVLITVWDAEDDYVEVYKGFYQGHEWWTQWCHGCSKIKDEPCGENIVIAWMPLPASYKGEQDKRRCDNVV